MEAALRRPLLFLDLLLLAAAAWLLASLAGVFAAAALAPGEVSGALAPTPPPPELAVAALDPDATARLLGISLSPLSADPPREPAPSPLRASVIATLVANRPPWSLATLRDELSGAVEVVRPGERFLDAVLEAVEPLRVIVVRDGRREYLSVTPGPGRAPAAVAAVAAGGDPAVIDRSELAHLDQLAAGCRIVPAFVGGKAVGFKLFGIRPGSIYQRAGLQNGDVIRGIDGMTLDSPDKAIEIYGKLHDSTRFELQLERRGQPLTKVVELR